jgi:Kef-type K+ transport system membrane component KefB
MSTALDTPATRTARGGRPSWLGAALYVLMLAAGVGAVFVVRELGAGLAAPAAPAGAVSVAAPKAGQVDVVEHVFATLAAVIALGFVLGRAFRLVGQPPVVGEVVAGILLGPSLLGAISPEAMHLFVPSAADDPRGQVAAALRAVAQLGVVLYMFLVGLELNAAHLRHKAHAAVAISHASIVAPFVLGLGLAPVLYPRVSHAGVPFVSFALFMGAALAVTAFPVLARILADRGLDRTPAGTVALGCAAADDVTAWCLLALVVGVARAEVGTALATVAGAAVFIVGMFVVAAPLARRACAWADAHETFPPVAVPVVFAAVLLSALATEAIGIHAVFGAFLLGAVIPHDSRVAREFTRALKDVVTVLLLPAFFALTGLRTRIGLLDSWESWALCAAVVAAATLGKFGGTYVAAKFAGYDGRTAAALGAMMNTRGLMGLIVLDVGLNMGVIAPPLYAMMVLMALATTLATAPALARLLPSPDARPRSPAADRIATPGPRG